MLRFVCWIKARHAALSSIGGYAGVTCCGVLNACAMGLRKEGVLIVRDGTLYEDVVIPAMMKTDTLNS